MLASSFLSTKGYRLDSDERCEEVDAQLQDLEVSVTHVLTTALSFGEVIIITNAEMGWVELSAKKFIPGVVGLLEHVHILSARTTYEAMYPDSPLKWKVHFFCAA